MLFINSERRSPLLPEVQTFAKAGLPDHKACLWYGLFGPAGTQRPVMEGLAAATEQARRDPQIAVRLGELGTPMLGYTPDRFTQYVRDEIEIWVPLVRASGARVE